MPSRNTTLSSTDLPYSRANSLLYNLTGCAIIRKADWHRMRRNDKERECPRVCILWGGTLLSELIRGVFGHPLFFSNKHPKASLIRTEQDPTGKQTRREHGKNTSRRAV